MSLLTKTSAASQIVAAMNSGDQNEMMQAWELFGEEVADNIRRDFEQFRETKDNSVLAQRGYRVLTSAEQAWYKNVSAALKSSKTKQAFIDILKSDDKDDLMPETIIDDVLRYLVETRPLLSKIRFQNAGYSTKWIINDNSVQRGGWGEIDAKIIQEIKGSLKVIDIHQAKYSAFCVVPLDILDMGPQFLDAFVRATMAEALGLGLEEAIVKGTGISMPIGMMKEPNGKQRTFDKVAMLCNMTDYLTKIMPATTVLSTTGQGYVNNLFPFPTEVIPCNAVPDGKAVLGILGDYTLAVGGSRNGNIEFDDSIGFLDDTRTFKLIQHAAGRAYDNPSFIVLDISALDPAYITVKNVEQAATQADTAEGMAVA